VIYTLVSNKQQVHQTQQNRARREVLSVTLIATVLRTSIGSRYNYSIPFEKRKILLITVSAQR
jgi:hypothetical protein